MLVMHQIGWHMRRTLTEELERHGLANAHWVILEILSESEREATDQSSPGESSSGATMRTIAAQIGVPPSSLTGMVDTLVERGLVERRADPNDRRIVRIALTDAGRQFGLDRRHWMYEAYREPTDSLSLEEMRAVRELFERMLGWYAERRSSNNSFWTRPNEDRAAPEKAAPEKSVHEQQTREERS